MARRRKAAAKPATRRMPRRGKAAAETAEGESSAAVDPPPETPAELEPPAEPAPAADVQPQPSVSQDSQINQTPKPTVPAVVLHKKFGKYRCLFNNEDTFTRRYDLGSDSETNSSVEIRVVDPCASSESDSNTAADTQSENTSVVTNFSALNNTNQNDSGNQTIPTVICNSKQTNSVHPIANETPMPCEAPLLTELPINSEIPLPNEQPKLNEEPYKTMPSKISIMSESTFISGSLPAGITLPSEIPLPKDAPMFSEKPFSIEPSLTSDIPFPSEPTQVIIQFPTDSVSPSLSLATGVVIPGIPFLNDIPMPETPVLTVSTLNKTADAAITTETEMTHTHVKDSSNIHKEVMNPEFPGDQEPMEYVGDDEELITIVQIVEDDNQDLYYNINIDSPDEATLHQLTDDAIIGHSNATPEGRNA